MRDDIHLTFNQSHYAGSIHPLPPSILGGELVTKHCASRRSEACDKFCGFKHTRKTDLLRRR